MPGGFSPLYRVLKQMEESGRVRRGWFVDGLSGAQFALAGALDRLRAARLDEPPMDGFTDRGRATAARPGPGQPLRRPAALARDARALAPRNTRSPGPAASPAPGWCWWPANRSYIWQQRSPIDQLPVAQTPDGDELPLALAALAGCADRGGSGS